MTASSSEGQPAAAPSIPRRRAVAIVVFGLLVAGGIVGVLWALLAPPVHGVVALTKSGERIYAHLGAEADHFFVAAFLLLGMLCVLGVTGATAAWQWRAHRGPLMVFGVSVGTVGAGGVAALVGALLVRAQYDVIDVAGAPISPEHRVHYVTEAPAVFFGHTPLQIATTLLVPAAAAAMVYAVAAVATPRDDLGAHPPVEGVVLRSPVVTVDGGEAPVR
ncbi:DUF2567 domain-containing protein [Mycobacterium sp. ACS4331]|uniref:DUF2567 domain-containing protein n=1 Tax=Mycobacterium sp. ACS4331 TaxID=1834121 RepID=UPI0007FFD5EF|nr:DUF2567 domain-containing protein [Mycobacterium sp. ACS4331]OBF11698.1 hypothetical protein A5727_19540 [Mycobacterium sp. ACS4331]